jgi:hypothetical protein
MVRASDVLWEIVRQAREMGEPYLMTLIHGHGRNRGISPCLASICSGKTGFARRAAGEASRTGADLQAKATRLDRMMSGNATQEFRLDASTRDHFGSKEAWVYQ